MENIEQVKAFVLNLDHSLDELEPFVEKLATKSLTERLSEVPALERAKLANGYTYILSSLLFAYLKSRGVDTSKHDIMGELNKCKSYMKRLKDLETVDSQENGKLKREKAMVDRFMKTQLSGNSTVVTGVQEPAISRVSFEGKHTKFADNKSTSDDDDAKPLEVKAIKPSKSGKLGKVTKPDTKKKQKKRTV